tara:strand:- start:88 stop:336 length:249 start_codon:yes stop_codon:yes gene_type:complete
MKIVVSRLEQYPEDEPTGWAVGFNVVAGNGRSFYVDTVISFDKADKDEDAIAVALQGLKKSINSRVTALNKKSALIGSEVSL